MRTNKEQEAFDRLIPKALSPSDEALFALLSSAANDDVPEPDMLAGLAQSHVDAARQRRNRLVFGAFFTVSMIAGMWLMFGD